MASASNFPPRIKPLAGESLIAQQLGIPSDSITPGYALGADSSNGATPADLSPLGATPGGSRQRLASQCRQIDRRLVRQQRRALLASVVPSRAHIGQMSASAGRSTSPT